MGPESVIRSCYVERTEVLDAKLPAYLNSDLHDGLAEEPHYAFSSGREPALCRSKASGRISIGLSLNWFIRGVSAFDENLFVPLRIVIKLFVTLEAMMALNKENRHFFSPDRIPEIEGSTPFWRTYQTLHHKGVGGFVMTENGHPKRYIDAAKLASLFLRRADGTKETLKQLSETAIREHVSDAEKRGERGVIMIEEMPAYVNEAVLLNEHYRAYNLVTDSGHRYGWFLNHEPIAETMTRRVVFICKRGHPNPDSDGGTCYRCPSEIVQSATIDS